MAIREAATNQATNQATNHFGDCMRRSRDTESWDGWDALYRGHFPTLLAWHRHPSDGWHQRSGIDVSITLASSKQILIDEKVRYRHRNGSAYDDIAIEYLAEEARGKPGWAVKPLLADYVAYVIMPLGRGYLLPVIQLQAAWARHGERWIAQYGTIRAYNESATDRWHSCSCPVPPPVLYAAIMDGLIDSFDPIG